MKLSVIAAIVATLLGCGGIAPASAADSVAQPRVHHRQDYARLYVRPSYQPYYYDRPVVYRPYGLVPFFFGLSFPYRTW